MNTIDTVLKWSVRIGITLIFLMMAAYIGLDQFVQYVEANYIVIEK